MQISRYFKSPFLIILLTAVISYWPIAFLIYTFKWDMLDVVLPFRYFAGECIHHGIFPLWNPYQLTGSPIYADLQYPLWSPEVWLIGLTTGYNIYVLHFLFVFYIFLAGYGMYRLVLHFTANRLSSVITGISYMLSGYFVGHGQALFSIIGASFLPWIVLYMTRNLSQPSLPNTLKLAIFLFLQLTTGYQAISIITGYLVLVIFLYYLPVNIKKRNSFISILKFNGILLVFVLLLSLVILVPLYGVSAFNERLSTGLTYQQSVLCPFTPHCLISLLTPWATVRYPEFFNTDVSMRNMHFGLIMAVIFAVTLFKRKTGLQWVLLLFGLICFLASMGETLPVHKFLYLHIPLLNRLRMPAYFNLFAIFSILFSAGMHLPHITEQVNSFRKPLVTVLTLTLIILAGLFGFAVLHINFADSVFLKAQPGLIPEGVTFHEMLALQSVFQGFLLAFLLITLLHAKLSRYFGKILPVLIIIEMVVAVNMNIFFTVISTTRPYELNDYMVSQPRGFPIPDNIPIKDNSDKSLMHIPLYRNMGILTKRISYDGFSSFILKPYNYLYDSLPRLKDSLLNNSIIYLSGNVKKISTLKNAAIAFNRRDLYVTDDVYASISDGLKKNAGFGKVVILSFSPDKIRVQYSTDSASVITLMQADHPGWKVKIDGREVPHFTSNYLYISAGAPVGVHEMIFEYRNRKVFLCFIISYSTLILMLLFLIYLHFRNLPVKKSRRAHLLIIVVIIFSVLSWIISITAKKKENAYRDFSHTLANLESGLTGSYDAIFNLDDTVLFNGLNSGKNTGIKYIRFNDTRDMGKFYRYVSASCYSQLMYGSFNLYNPPETEFIIRKSFPYLEKKTGTRFAAVKLYSRSGNGNTLPVLFSSKNDFESPAPGWTNNPGGYNNFMSVSGDYSERMDSVNPYSTTFRSKIHDISKKKDIFLVITADVYLVGNANPLLIYEEKNGAISKKWMSLDVRKFIGRNSCWGKVFLAVRTGKDQKKDDTVSIYFWNNDNGNFYIDNFNIEGYLTHDIYSQ